MSTAQPREPALRIALLGVPNCGKTALFNRLTGSHQKVANYPGVTVERKVGTCNDAARGRSYRVLDLPGAYSLAATTLDEAITRDVVAGRLADEPPPELIVSVLDATNLRLSLRLVLELKRLKRPMIVVLNMSDIAAARGIAVNRERLAAELGCPVVETVAVRSGGERALLEALAQARPADEVDTSAWMPASMRLRGTIAQLNTAWKIRNSTSASSAGPSSGCITMSSSRASARLRSGSR